jgi:hypothetical protein
MASVEATPNDDRDALLSCQCRPPGTAFGQVRSGGHAKDDRGRRAHRPGPLERSKPGLVAHPLAVANQPGDRTKLLVRRCAR